jgi:multidrug efflux pump subunit AcrA (membrane-fusion protein)
MIKKALRSARRPRIWVPVLVVLLAVAGSLYWFVLRSTTSSAAAASTSTTRSVAASLTTLQQSISTTGTLTPSVQESVNFAAAGTVTAVNVKAGDTVTTGEVLATIDTLSLNADLLSAKATLANAEAKLTTDTDNSATTEQLAADQAAIDVANSKVTTANDALNSATLTAPVDGIIASMNLTVGQKVSAGGSSSSASSASSASSSGASASSSSSAQFLIVGTASWTVNVTVDDSQVGLVKAGDQAEITVASSTDPIFGTIDSVGLISTSTTSTASYPVVVAVTGSPSGLHDGTSATVNLIYERRTNVLAVPSAAVHTVDGATVVYQTVNGAQVSTPVTTGETADSMTEITAGLNEGDEVLVTVTTGGASTGTGGRTGTGTENRQQQQGGNFGDVVPPAGFGGSAPVGGN